MNTSGVLCSFCNEGIESTHIDPCDLTILINCDKSQNEQHNQTFWCHLECFKQALHIKVQPHLAVHLLNDDIDDD